MNHPDPHQRRRCAQGRGEGEGAGKGGGGREVSRLEKENDERRGVGGRAWSACVSLSLSLSLSLSFSLSLHACGPLVWPGLSSRPPRRGLPAAPRLRSLTHRLGPRPEDPLPTRGWTSHGRPCGRWWQARPGAGVPTAGPPPAACRWAFLCVLPRSPGGAPSPGEQGTFRRAPSGWGHHVPGQPPRQERVGRRAGRVTLTGGEKGGSEGPDFLATPPMASSPSLAPLAWAGIPCQAGSRPSWASPPRAGVRGGRRWSCRPARRLGARTAPGCCPLPWRPPWPSPCRARPCPRPPC